MQRKKSFVNEILRFLLILIALMMAILGMFLVSSYHILEKEISDSSKSFLEIYSNETHNKIVEMNGILKSITSRNVDLAKIKSHNNNERILASISMSNYMQDIMLDRDTVDVLTLYDDNYDISLDAIKTGFDFKKKNMLKDFTSNAILNDQINSFEWNFLEVDDETYLYKMLLTDSRAVAIYIRTNHILDNILLDESGNRSIFLANNKGEIGGVWGAITKDIDRGKNIDNINLEDYYQIEKEIVKDQLSIYCFTRKSSVLQQTNTGMIIVATAVFATMMLMIFVLRYTKKQIANPMDRIVGDIERIKNGEYQNRVSGDFKTREFQMLQEATNQMLDEIVGLKIQTYEKRIELQDMELKSIRLQIKPHFFLNALTTISSLSSQKKFEEINNYITSLSKNIRYMFRAGLHTISIKEEINHVKNYFEMQELKYPGCIFYLIDLPKELEHWVIPQMLIHTFIENEFKYAVSMDKILTILIKVSLQTYQNEEMLLIEIEDDGKGYPEEVLDYMNGKTKKVSDKGNRVGLWSIKRMIELMYERNDLMILENIKPFGCLNKIYIPKNTKNKIDE
ncbi:MAG TPA: histidine kinase [Clostridiales bacterium]|nr:histidine kinase [Clostridiales bacterium]